MIFVPSAKMSLTPTDECVLRRSTMRTAASLKADPYHGLDSRWSWITAAFCSWVMFMGTLSIRVSGVLFYGIVETFQVTREEASWPVTLNGSLLNLAGPVMGYLCRQVSCRSVLLICSLFTGVCVCVCYFAKGLLFLNIFFGVLHGKNNLFVRKIRECASLSGECLSIDLPE